MQNKYDVVIIGGGISGLTLGALLGKFGFKCCIVEKEPHPGGYLAGFKRKDFFFDTAIHWLNQFNKEGIAHRCFSFIDADYPKPVPLKKIQRYQTDDFNILVNDNIDDVKAGFLSYFPDEEKGINKFFGHVLELAEASHKLANFARSAQTMTPLEKAMFYTRALPAVFPLLKHLKYTGNKGVKKGLDKYFKNYEIKDIFSSESDLLSCLFPLAWAKNNDYYSTPPGGSITFVKWLSDVNNKLGNTLMLNTEVVSITTNKNRATGVEVNQSGNKLPIASKYVIIASDLITAYRKLLSAGTIPERKINLIENAVQYKSGFSVSVALDCPAENLGFGEELTLLFKNNLKRYKHEEADPLHSKLNVLSPSVRDKTVCPPDKGIVSIYMNAGFEKYNYWQTTMDEKGNRMKGEAYHQLKEDVANKMIERVDNEINAEFSKHILFYEIATPITYHRYTGNHNGSIMGAKPGKENMKNKVASYFTPVKNLLVGGQWAELGGGVPITSKAAMNATLIVLKQENKKMFRQFANYFDGKKSLQELNKVISKQPFTT